MRTAGDLEHEPSFRAASVDNDDAHYLKDIGRQIHRGGR
jgi:hypothetical protein